MEGYDGLTEAIGMMFYTAVIGTACAAVFLVFLIRAPQYSIRGLRPSVLFVLIVGLATLLAFSADNFLWDVMHHYGNNALIAGWTYPLTFLIGTPLFRTDRREALSTANGFILGLLAFVSTAWWIAETVL